MNIYRKSNGTLTISITAKSNWELIAECNSPSELIEKSKGLTGVIVLRELSKSQHKANLFGNGLSQRDALYCFWLTFSAKNVQENF